MQFATGAADKNGTPESVTIEDYRVQVQIDAPGGYQFATCRAAIYGLGKETMDRLFFINFQSLDFMRNTILIEATDENGEYASVFRGDIYQAIPDYNSMPNVPLIVEAYSGMISKLQPTTADSYSGAQRVENIMKEQARVLGLNFENNGVDSVIVDQVLMGSPLEKALKLKENARIEMWYLPEENTLAIAPLGTPRKSEPFKYNMSTGLVGFPMKQHVGITFQALYNPEVRHGFKIEMDSEIPACNGEWYVTGMTHMLSSELPGGPWFSHITATPQNTFVRIR